MKFNKEKRYYVYAWYIKDSGEVFYIGKGTGNRYKTRKRENVYFMRIINKYDCEPKIVKDGLSEKEAFDLEIKLIAYYRVHSKRLTNVLDGGDSPPNTTGIPRTDEWKKHISENLKKFYNENPEAKENISKRMKVFLKTEKGKEFTRKSVEAKKNDEYRNISQERIVDRDARFMDAGKMAAFVEENFSDCWNVVALRNAQYYQTQILEQQSEFGGMRLVFEEEKLVCIYAYAKEEGLEIREPLYLEEKEDLFWASVDGLREPEEKVSVYGLKEAPDWPDDETSAYKEKPLIMIRIVHLQELFSKMKIPSECEIHCSFAVIDPILHKNSRIWKLSSSKGEESLSVSETEDSQGVLSIAALTEILFGYKTPEEIGAEESVILTEELEEELRKLQNFCPIFLNEIV